MFDALQPVVRHLLAAGALLAAGVLAGCQSAPVHDPAFAPTYPSPPPQNAATPGAIYQASWNMPLFTDTRAHQVGDILTIVLQEQTQASKSAETKTSKDTSTNITNPTILGKQVNFGLPGALPLSSTSNANLGTSLSSTHSFDGSGTSTQSNALTGEISVTVAQVLPNGNLVVQGEKLLTLNQGSEHIRIKGIVRPEDISADNTVPSTKVANAEIAYAGQGDGPIGAANAIGWLAKFFMSAFMPF